MLYLNKTRIVAAKPMAVAAGVTVADEGLALVVVDEGGAAVVKPATGSANEVFAGFATFERRTPTSLAQVKAFPGTGEEQTITLPNMVAGSALIKINGNDLDGGTPEASITNGVLTIIAAVTATDVITVQYSYNPTVPEAERLVGSVFSASAVSAGANVGAIYNGEVYTSCFDTSVEWTAGAAVKLGAGGVVTTGGSGATIANAFVSHVPTEGEPYLGIDLR